MADHDARPLHEAFNEGENRYRQLVLGQKPLPGYPIIAAADPLDTPAPAAVPDLTAINGRLDAISKDFQARHWTSEYCNKHFGRLLSDAVVLRAALSEAREDIHTAWCYGIAGKPFPRDPRMSRLAVGTQGERP